MDKQSAKGRARQSRVKAGGGAVSTSDTWAERKSPPVELAPGQSAPPVADLRTRLYEGK